MKKSTTLIIIIATILLMVSCGQNQNNDLVGEWTRIADPESNDVTKNLWFTKDGSFTCSMNNGEILSGKYGFVEKNKIKVEYNNSDNQKEYGLVSVQILDGILVIKNITGSISKFNRNN